MLVPHTANLITLKPLALLALQATTAALLDQATAPKQYAQLGPIHWRARIRARSVLRENTAWKVALQLRVADLVLRELTRSLAQVRAPIAARARSPGQLDWVLVRAFPQDFMPMQLACLHPKLVPKGNTALLAAHLLGSIAIKTLGAIQLMRIQ